MSYYPEPDCHRNKIKGELDLSNDASKKNQNMQQGADTSDLAAKKDFIALKAEIDKLCLAKLANAPTNLNNLKTKVNDLDVGKLTTVPINLKNQVIEWIMDLLKTQNSTH